MQERRSCERFWAAKLRPVKIDLVRDKLSTHEPERIPPADHRFASVALVLRDGRRSAEVLLIERAIRDGDPWSGHMAFPGGRLEAGDPSTRFAAERETLEEVGVELSGAEYLGHLDDTFANPRIQPRLVISAHAFHLDADPAFVLDEREVQAAFWFPLVDLLDSARHVEHVIPQMPEVKFPGIEVGVPGRHIVWGLTYRFLDRMLEVLDHPFENRWGDLSAFQRGDSERD